MKKFFTLICAGVLGASLASAAGLQVTFNGTDNEGWGTSKDDAVLTVANGHFHVVMGKQNETKYRADVAVNGISYEMGSDDKYVAVKFIGTRPTGNMSFEMHQKEANNWLNNVWNNNKYNGSIVTKGGNTIYYYELAKAPNYAGAFTCDRMNIKLADATEAPFEYTIDWVKSYPSVEAIEADKDWQDDGANDNDEGATVTLPVVNETTGTGYNNLADALSAASAEQVLVLNEDQALPANDRYTIGTSLTLKGGKDGVKIIRACASKINLLVNNKAAVTFENLTFDGASLSSEAFFMEVSGGGEGTFKNVVFTNFECPKKEIIQAKNSGKVHFEGVKSETNNAKAEVFIGSGGSSISGDNDVTIYLEKANTLSASDLTNTTPIVLLFDANRSTAVLVNGWDNVNNFSCGIAGFSLVSKEGNIEFTSSTGIEGVTTETAEYVNVYNMQGILVRENAEASHATEGLATGLYIAGGKKVYVK